VNGSGTTYPNIQLAVDAASDGDVLIVSQGNYPAFTIDGKGLAFQLAPGSTSVSVFGMIEIENLGAQQSVAISDFVVQGEFSLQNPYALWLSNDAGAVLFQHCSITGSGRFQEYPTTPPTNPAVLVASSSRVSFTACTITGGFGGGGCGSMATIV